MNVSKWLGYSKIRTTYNSYLKVIKEMQQENKFATYGFLNFLGYGELT